ncbi:MAG: hypothetical protein RL120_06020, partial [Gammaproteobacteria bacterium]
MIWRLMNRQRKGFFARPAQALAVMLLAIAGGAVQAQSGETNVAVFETTTGALTIPALPFDGAIYEIRLQLNGDGQTLRLVDAIPVSDRNSMNPAVLDLDTLAIELPQISLATNGSLDAERFSLTLTAAPGEGFNFGIGTVQLNRGSESLNNPYRGLVGIELAVAMIDDLDFVSLMGDLTTVYLFDERGRNIAEHYRDSSGSATDFYVYDSRDRLLTRTRTFNDDYQLADRTYYFYDELDRVRLRVTEQASGDRSQTEFIWNGNTAAEIYSYMDADNPSLNYSTEGTITVDSQGRRIASTGVNDTSTEIVYDSNGLRTDLYSHGPTGTARWHYVYNDEGNLLRREFETTDADSVIDSLTIFEYESYDLTGDGLIDAAVLHQFSNVDIGGATVGSQDSNYQGSS